MLIFVMLLVPKGCWEEKTLKNEKEEGVVVKGRHPQTVFALWEGEQMDGSGPKWAFGWAHTTSNNTVQKL